MKGSVHCCGELFEKSAYLFAMPAIQRPYDWGEAEAEALLNDLLSALGPETSDTKIRALEPYLLGPFVLAEGRMVDGGSSDLRYKYVVDGQQRIITLCLLLAAARARFLETGQNQSLADEIQAMLKLPASIAKGHKEVLRVQMHRQEDTHFLDSLMLQPDFQPTQLVGESQPKLLANLQLYKRLLAQHDVPRITSLVQFTLQRVRVTVTLASSFPTALKYFAVSSTRGKQLQPIDVLKGVLFEPNVMAEGRHDEYGQKWGNLERLEGMGREGISRVCAQLAVIHLKQERGRRSEFDEPQMVFRELAGNCGDRAGPAFFGGVLEPYTKLYLDMMSEEGQLRGGTDDQRGDAAYLITCLRRLSPKLDDWEPLALAALMQHRLGHLDAAALIELLKELERLSWFWMLCKVPKNVRRKRVAQVLEELGLGGQQLEQGRLEAAAGTAGGDAHDEARRLVPPITTHAAPALSLTTEEQAAMVAALDGPLYTMLKGKPIIALLARLNERKWMGLPHMQPYKLENSKLTVEHVLPQKPPAGSDWERNFTAEEREHWLHRLGNLMLLPRKLNSAASNRSFASKQQAWSEMRESVSLGLPLTDAVCEYERWDADAAAKMHGEAVRFAISVWRLHGTGGPSIPQP